MARTTAKAVINLLGRDYTPSRDVTVFLDTASAIVDDLVTYASDNELTAVPAARLELIERWLAAHCYTQSDRIYMNNSTLRSSGSYALGKNQTPYLDQANTLDPTGYLNILINGDASASAFWAGKAPSEQTDYVDRD